jgi:hypothetical protein
MKFGTIRNAGVYVVKSWKICGVLVFLKEVGFEAGTKKPGSWQHLTLTCLP